MLLFPLWRSSQAGRSPGQVVVGAQLLGRFGAQHVIRTHRVRLGVTVILNDGVWSWGSNRELYRVSLALKLGDA